MLYEKAKVEATKAAKPKFLILLDFIKAPGFVFKLSESEASLGINCDTYMTEN